MQIPAEQVAYKKQIGKLGESPVWELGLKGGLHLVVAAHKGKTETLGVGPHRAVARHVAKKMKPDLNITELSKSEYFAPEHYAHLLPAAEADTRALRRRQGYED